MAKTKRKLVKRRNDEIAEMWNPEAKNHKYNIEKEKRVTKIQDAIYHKVK